MVFMHNILINGFGFSCILGFLSLVLLGIGFTLMGVLTGDRVNGAAFDDLLWVQFQPSELAKMAVIIAVSFILQLSKKKMTKVPTESFYIIVYHRGYLYSHCT